MPIVKTIKSSVEDALKNDEVRLLALNLNCVKNQKDYEDLFNLVPELKVTDDNFELPSLYRLGDYSVATTEQGPAFLLFYTNLTSKDKLEISALKSCLKKLSQEAIASRNYISLGMVKTKENWDVVQKLLSFQEYLLITIIDND